MKHLFILLILLAILPACYEDVEGCLDVNAANYDLDADRGCPNNNCCDYPTLSVAVTHLYGDTGLRLDTFYQDGAGNRFRISRLRYYWSDLALQQADGSRLEPSDPLDIGLISADGDTILTEINDNLVLLNASSSTSRAFGTFRTEQAVTALTGLSGIEDDYQVVAPGTAPSNHPLGFQVGRLYYGLDTGYVQYKLEYDLIVADDTLATIVEAYGNQPLTLDFGAAFTLPRGFDIVVRLEADLDEWLAGLDVSVPDAALSQQLGLRFPLVFRVVAIEGS